MKRSRILAIVACGLAFTGCLDPWEGSGTVVEREYDDPDEWTTQGECAVRSDPDDPWSWCVLRYPDHEHYDPEHFILVVDDNGDKHDVEVPESLWTSCRLGQRFTTATMECRST